jgi:hypothetical protein
MLSQINKLWLESPPLTFTCLAMFLAFVILIPGIWMDRRLITGAPAWLKPAKFALSASIYSGSLAWLFRYINIHRNWLTIAGWITAIVLVVEVGIIVAQAFRGTTSHFNVSTPLDATLWGIMGSSIAVLWMASVFIALTLFLQPFADQAWGWTLRLAMAITVFGSATGGMMGGPTRAQTEAMQQGRKLPVIGAHTVGAPDGGAGLPGVNWSSQHGDLRIPHFLGMHALQLLPLLMWAFGRGQIRFAFALAGSYAALCLILGWQALRGQSIAQPDGATLFAFGGWLLASLALVASGGLVR